MGAKVDLTGMRFGRLVAVRYTSSRNKKRYWLCKCDCGNEIEARSGSLVTGNTQSCGCQRVESLAQVHTKHGYAGTRLYRIWKSIRSRCNNPNAENYKYYGGRGITYDPSFETFEGFLAGMPEGYDDSKEIDRIDNNGNYEPGNLRWATRLEQANNMSSNRILTLPDGRKLTIAQTAAVYGIATPTLRTRLDLGWSIEKAISTPVISSALKRMLLAAILAGENISAIAEKFNVSEDTVSELL